MTKQDKTIMGIGLLAIAGVMLWLQNKEAEGGVTVEETPTQPTQPVQPEQPIQPPYQGTPMPQPDTMEFWLYGFDVITAKLQELGSWIQGLAKMQDQPGLPYRTPGTSPGV